MCFLEFSGVVMVHVYPEPVLGVMVSYFFSWNWVSSRDRDRVCVVGGGSSQFIVLLL